MTAFPSPNMMMRRRKTEHEIRQEVVSTLHELTMAPTQHDIDRHVSERMADELALQESYAEYLINIRNLNGEHQ